MRRRVAITRGLGAMTDTWRNALDLMKTALNALDEAEAPPHLRAQLDHVICQLENTHTKQKKEPTRRRQAATSRQCSNLT